MTVTTRGFTSIEELLGWGREREVYSAAAWSVGTAERELTGGAVGTRSWGVAPLTRTDLFDLASVTKPLVGIVIMALLERGVLTLSSTVGELLPSFQDTDKSDLTVRDLMLHTSGVPGQVPMYRSHPTREAMLEGLRILPLRRRPGEAVEYTSQGFILLGLMAESAAGVSLSALMDEYVSGPLGLESTRFRPGEEDRDRCVATEDCRWRGRVVVGEVHDENAVVLGGVTGHAGLFSSVDDMARLGRALVANLDRRVLLHPVTFATMIENRTAALGEARGLAWQGIDPDGSPVGDLLSPEAFGHTGFTGTSLFVDPRLGRYFVLLTNRVHPSRERTGIRHIRQVFHNLAATTLNPTP
ncbi:serine hydrolase domain-containing protein [Phytoactinopolyspora halotolerans]|uniref:Serine hydrolase n=1 Tax=Phytoactinopolyspora halotolerans TaxID=1981512 RepID=A0A6L9S3S0_9ACTN|nr:serine hydrolase [Phytoactinopolyspora halotolerans]NED99241.1 serine hydrolase [Phytoactinopolyspora halotolerans]